VSFKKGSEQIVKGTSAQLGYTDCHLRWFTLENTGEKTN